jgi:hypothetical protein
MCGQGEQAVQLPQNHYRSEGKQFGEMILTVELEKGLYSEALNPI